ncbi:MAG: ABC transporter permease [Anaerolineaceae bacterium]
MRAIFLLALKDLQRQWGLAVIMALLFGVTFASYLTLITYEQSESKSYSSIGANWLVVGSSSGLGEIYGSQISTNVGDQLREMGYENPIPELRQIVGTSARTMIMVRGMSLDNYSQVTPYKMIAGRALQPGDDSRLTMVGAIIARSKDLKVGGTVTLRGRKFDIVGIFETGALEDNQVWISLVDAQTLVNYDNDVSIYFIPSGGSLKIGDIVGEGISVSQKGENGKLYDHSLQSFFRFMRMVGLIAGIATIITLINLLWRLAYLHRHEFGIMKTVGFRLNAFLLYFGTQSGIILFAGLLVGLSTAFGVLFTGLKSASVFGYGLAFSWSIQTLFIMVGLTLGIFTIGVIAPMIGIQRTPIPDLLGRN